MSNETSTSGSADHTSGPVEQDTRGYPHADVRSSWTGRKIAITWGTGAPKTEQAYRRRTKEDRANARRIVACWNACLGIDTEVLEALASQRAELAKGAESAEGA